MSCVVVTATVAVAATTLYASCVNIRGSSPLSLFLYNISHRYSSSSSSSLFPGRPYKYSRYIFAEPVPLLYDAMRVQQRPEGISAADLSRYQFASFTASIARARASQQQSFPARRIYIIKIQKSIWDKRDDACICPEMVVCVYISSAARINT